MMPRAGSIPGPEGRNNKMIPTCAQCGGTLERQPITHTQLWGNELYEFESVPALVCRQCGEVWLEAAVGQLIDKIVQQQPRPKKYHQVPVFSLAEFSF
jgi:YgiT-type zinc finger domain-containing protein